MLRFKLDENMPAELVPDFIALGHDAETCVQEGLLGAGDDVVSAHATAESRIVFTFDLDFANIMLFPIGSYAGHVVVRIKRPSIAAARSAMRRVLASVTEAEFDRSLIIVDPSRIRIRRPPSTP